MKYRVTLKDGIELLITADKEVDAVRQAKDIKDSLSAAVKLSDEVPNDFEMRDLKAALPDAKGLVSAIEAAMVDRSKISAIFPYLHRIKRAFHDN